LPYEFGNNNLETSLTKQDIERGQQAGHALFEALAFGAIPLSEAGMPKPRSKKNIPETKGDLRILKTEGACNGLDPNIFFNNDDESVEIAKHVCGLCAVAEICRDYSFKTRQEFGIWGGLSEEERRIKLKIRKKSDLA
jgi:WhiB family redox-sensing transcriptional regulator